MKRILMVLSFNALLAAVFLVGMFSAYFSVRNQIMWYSANKSKIEAKPFDSYDVFNALNAYRSENGLPPLTLSQPLCNNLVERWKNYRNTNSHSGLDEWVRKEMPDGLTISEIMAPGMTAEQTVENWSGSQGHDVAIKSNSKICIYTADNLSVAVLSN